MDEETKELLERFVEVEEERLEVQRELIEKLDALDSRLFSMLGKIS